jgi:hypothetical protein
MTLSSPVHRSSQISSGDYAQISILYLFLLALAEMHVCNFVTPTLRYWSKLQEDELLIYTTEVVLQAKEVTVGWVCNLGMEIVNARTTLMGWCFGS